MERILGQLRRLHGARKIIADSPARATKATAGAKNNRGSVMEISVGLAEKLSVWANVALVISLIAGVVSTFLIVVTGNVKEAALNGTVGAMNAALIVTKNEAAKANLRAETLHRSNLEMQTRLVDAERALESEKLERLNLQASIAPRHLSIEQRQRLIDSLIAAPQPLSINLQLIGDEEAGHYGQQMMECFAAAKINGRPDRSGMIAPPPYGIIITMRENDNKALAIKVAFEAAKIKASYSIGNTGEFDAIVLVGLRPLGIPEH